MTTATEEDIERRLRGAFAAMARSTTIHDPGDPPLATVESAGHSLGSRSKVFLAAAAVVLLAVASGVVAALGREGARSEVETSSPTPTPGEDRGQPQGSSASPGRGDDLLRIDGTSISIPASVDGFEPPSQHPFRLPGDAAPMRLVTFDRPGPMPGTIGGSMTVLVTLSTDSNETLRDLDSPDGVAEAAALLGYDPDSITIVHAGDRIVLEAPGIATIPGGDIGYGDRVYSEYTFASDDGSAIVQINTDVLTEQQVLNFISRVSG